VTKSSNSRRAKNSKARSSASDSSVRIIGGQWRGSRIVFSESDGLRPTSDRIRETLFNWLAADILDSRCLDLFAGSGALAFEALSRGASEVFAVEKNAVVYRKILDNKRRLKIDNLKLLNTDSINWLAEQKVGSSLLDQSRYDIIFVDPPFHGGIPSELLETLSESGLFKSGAKIYLEQPKVDAGLRVPTDWQLLKEKEAGQVRYSLYCAR